MATSIQVSRVTKASSMAALQADTQVYQVTTDLAALLAARPLALITGAEVLAVLQVPYPAATIEQSTPLYWWEYVNGEWKRHCLSGSVITIPGTAGKEAILVAVQDRAQYEDTDNPPPES